MINDEIMAASNMVTIEYISLITGALAIALITYFVWRNKMRWFYAVPAYLYLAHIVFFYAVLLLNLDNDIGFDVTSEGFNIWSATIRLQGTITIIILTIVLLWGYKFDEHH